MPKPKIVKYLVAADPNDPKVQQVTNARDFFHATPGEMVTVSAFVCTDKQKRAACGCGRSLGDITSMKSTTLIVVAEANEKDLQKNFEASRLVDDYKHMTAKTAWKKLVEPTFQTAKQYPVSTILRVWQEEDEFGVLPA